MATENEQSKFTQREVEKHVKQIMGPAPQESQLDEDEPKTERVLVINEDNTKQALPGAPTLAGSVINPSPDAVPTDTTPTSETKPTTPAPKPTIETPKSKGRIRRFFRKLWKDPRRRAILLSLLFVLAVGIVAFPASRYFVLNNLGVRSRASVVVLDEATGLPLKNVKVSLANGSGTTDDNGSVKLEHLKLGHTNLIIEKRAFATRTESVTVGWGSNPLGDYPIKGVGEVYSFVVKDWLTGKPIEKAEAATGVASAFSDHLGKIRLTVDPADITDDMMVEITADGYRKESVTVSNAATSDQSVSMVIDEKVAFISNRSGKYDLYTIDPDGKNEKLVLKATGVERDDLVLVQHPNDPVAALVSTRVNVRNSEGFLLSTLTLVNLEDGSTFAAAQSERIQVVGWVGDRLIFVQIAAGASADDPNRFRLISYNQKTADKTEIAKGNSFNDILLVGSSIYYSVSSAYQKDPNVGLIKSNADGSFKQTILDKEVWNIFRVSYDTLNLAVSSSWYEYKIGTSNAVKLHESPANPKNRLYANNSVNTHSLWVDERDGKGVLIDYNINDDAEKTLLSKGGLDYPVKWLTDSVFVYRLKTVDESADYVMSLDGGEPRKITDVYNAAGIQSWYFY